MDDRYLTNEPVSAETDEPDYWWTQDAYGNWERHQGPENPQWTAWTEPEWFGQPRLVKPNALAMWGAGLFWAFICLWWVTHG